MEKWATVKGYENYAVSNYGAVRNTKRNRHIRPFKDKNGYMLVNLYDAENRMRTLKVHRLVLAAFVPNVDMKEQVNHIDGNKANNCLENLEWATQSENQRHRRNVLGKNGGGLDRCKVMCVETGVVYESIMQAERMTTALHQHIGNCLRGERQTAGGYHWKSI